MVCIPVLTWQLVLKNLWPDKVKKSTGFLINLIWVLEHRDYFEFQIFTFSVEYKVNMADIIQMNEMYVRLGFTATAAGVLSGA